MNKTLHKVLRYITMSLLFMILSSIVLYIAGMPVASYIIAHGDMIIVKGAPANLHGNQTVNTDGILEKSEIQKPELKERYGTITCKRIALTAPVYYGDSNYSLLNGVGQYAGSKMPGEGRPILISGHDSTFFAPLEKIKTGDIVKITTDYGKFEYKVIATKVAGKTDTAAYDLTQKKEQLILYTCYPFGAVTGDRSKRYFIYCDRMIEKAEAVD